MIQNSETKAVISILAAAIGSASLGLFIVLAEASTKIKAFLNFYDPVGPLSGKTTLATLIFFLSWFGLNQICKTKALNTTKTIKIAFILIGIALILSFPPFFELFTAAH